MRLRDFSRVVSAVALMAASGVVQAQLQQCTQYRARAAAPWSSSAGEACAELYGYCTGANNRCGNIRSESSFGNTGVNPSNPNQCRIEYCAGGDNCGGATPSAYTASITTRNGEYCEPPPPEEDECEDIGKSKMVTSSVGMGGFKWCEGNCRWQIMMNMCGDEGCSALAKIVSSCGPEGPGGDPPEGPPDDVDDGGAEPSDEPPESCQPVGDGEYCMSNSGDGNCGYLNDKYVCPGKVRDDECIVAADGSRLCGSAVGTTPPAPDNGTPGQVAEPDGQITIINEGGVTNVFNYYGSSTVAGSSRDPGTTGASVGASGGSPNAPTPGDADGNGQQDCEEVSGGCGPHDSEPDEENANGCFSAGDSWQSVAAACGVAAIDEADEVMRESALYTFFADLYQSVPVGGSCPSASFSAWGDSYDFGEVACDLVDSTQGTLSLLFLLLWSFVGLRILIGTFAGGE